jgi:glycosyltransferase involved in cell wall biosynthesis
VVLSLQAQPALYAAFDVYPSAKGAATHIQQAARTLFDTAGGGLLYVQGHPSLPRYQREGNVEILRSSRLADNYLYRALHFGGELDDVLAGGLRDSLRIAQFRDPWSGAAILNHAAGRFATVYEVNGLPSIELPVAYPEIGAATLAKIRALEDDCLAGADRIVVPSAVIRDNLMQRAIDPQRVEVIANGTELIEPSPHPAPTLGRYLLYFGAPQSWQGLDVLLRAWARMWDLPDLHLVICCSVRSRRAKAYRKLAERLEIADRIHWEFGLSRDALAPWVSNAYLTLAPLTECARNLDQGCCPLKILESMGAGVPVVASDLPVVRELVAHRYNGYLVRPGRPAELARAIRVLLEFPQTVAAMGREAQQTIRDGFLWSHANARLQALHRDLLEVDRNDQTILTGQTGRGRSEAVQS